MSGGRANPSLPAAALAASLESALAAAVAADGLGMDRFAHLFGKRLRFVCESPTFSHTWIVAPDGIVIASSDGEPADLSIRGPLNGLLSLLISPSESSREGIELDGDETLLEAFTTALGGLRPDFALLLEPLVGAPAAAGLDAVAQASSRAVQEFAGYAAERLRGLDRVEAQRELVEQVSAGVARWLERLREPPRRP